MIFANNKEGSLAACAFALVLLVFGVPVWWCTTMVYRAALPCSAVEVLSEKANIHTVPVTIIAKEPLKYVKQLKIIFKKSDLLQFLFTSSVLTKWDLEIINHNEDIESLDASFSGHRKVHSGCLAIVELPEDLYYITAETNIIIGVNRIIYVKNNVDIFQLASLLKSVTYDKMGDLSYIFEDPSLVLKQDLSITSLRQLTAEPGYDLMITLMLPEPQITKAEWDIETAISDYLSPLTRQLKNVMTFNIRSQVLYMTTLNIFPKWSAEHNYFIIPEENLPHTVNPIEARLGSFVSVCPAINWIVYIPKEEENPLFIHSSEGLPVQSNSFLVPRWGGVVIQNMPKLTKDTALPRTVQLDSNQIMNIVVTQLKRLLPVPSLTAQDGIQVLLPNSSQLTHWQLDGLSRVRVASYLGNVRTTLKSLCDLVNEISNMVVSDEVAGYVWAAVDEWRLCHDASAQGLLEEATLYCRDAFVHANDAFFHPSMLGRLYFPDNQKYAIYVPLFLPVSIPVLLSLKIVVGLLRGEQKVKQD